MQCCIRLGSDFARLASHALVAVFERSGKVLSKSGAKVKRHRWLIFNDEEGVHGDKPYYHVYGKFSDHVKDWVAVKGSSE